MEHFNKMFAPDHNTKFMILNGANAICVIDQYGFGS